MQGLQHPYSRALYEPDGGGRARVTQRDGRVGVYTPEGRWIEGEKFDVDPHLCGWICGPRSVHRVMNTASH